ncbi:hypothetical protein GW17_00046436 [Ensete ventricosum]|nr:hypothetical protein GW17_00046436 [Ensete ventricosum]
MTRPNLTLRQCSTGDREAAAAGDEKGRHSEVRKASEKFDLFKPLCSQRQRPPYSYRKTASSAPPVAEETKVEQEKQAFP